MATCLSNVIELKGVGCPYGYSCGLENKYIFRNTNELKHYKH